jgi:hypothetical protein
VLREAEALLIARLGAVSLAELARDFDAQCDAAGWAGVSKSADIRLPADDDC